MLALLLGLGLFRLELRTDGAALYPIGNRAVDETQADRKAFFESDQFIVLITSRPDGPRLDSRDGLHFIKKLHVSLSQLDGVYARRVRSIASLLDPRPGLALISTGYFLDDIPEDDGGYRDLIARIADAPLAHGLFLSATGRAASIYVPVFRDSDRDALATALESALRQVESDFALRLTGPTTAEVMLGRAVLRDLFRMVPIMVGVVALLTFACLRSLGSVLIAMGEVGLVLIATLGAMGLSGTPITLVTTILPVLVMTVAITDEIHLLDRFRTHLAKERDQPNALEAIRQALKEVTRPIVLTSLTTSIAFLSFLSTSVLPLRHFGLFAALGVLLAMLMSLTFVPALCILLPTRWFTSGLAGATGRRGQATR